MADAARLLAEVNRLETQLEEAADKRRNLTEAARDPRLTGPARASLERQAAAAEKDRRKTSEKLRMAKARLREAQRGNR